MVFDGRLLSMFLDVSVVVVFPILFLWSMWWHECMHSVSAWLSGAVESYCYISFRNLGMYHFCIGGDGVLIDLCGGVLCSIFCFCLALFSSGVFLFCFLCLGWLQLCVGVFEFLFLHRWSFHDFRVGRYSLYVVVVCVWLLLWCW